MNLQRKEPKQKINQSEKRKKPPKKQKKASRPRVSEDESCPWFTCPFDTDSQQIEHLDLITSLL